MLFIELFCNFVLSTMTLLGVGILTFCFYTLCASCNKVEEQEHAAILQAATRRRLSIRPDIITSPTKITLNPNKLTKSANFTTSTFKHFKDE